VVNKPGYTFPTLLPEASGEGTLSQMVRDHLGYRLIMKSFSLISTRPERWKQKGWLQKAPASMAGRTGSYPGISNAVAAIIRRQCLFVQGMLIIHDY